MRNRVLRSLLRMNVRVTMIFLNHTGKNQRRIITFNVGNFTMKCTQNPVDTRFPIRYNTHSLISRDKQYMQIDVSQNNID